MSWEVKNDISGQSEHGLRVCKVKIRKILLPGHVHVLENLNSHVLD